MDIPVFDVHEHHMPEVLGNQDVGLLALLWQSYAGWTQARPYPLPSEEPFEDPMFAGDGKGSWEDVAKFVEHSGSNSFIRNMIQTLSDLYDLGDDGITPQNWEKLDAKIRRRHSDDAWHDEVLDRAGINRVITDPFNDPMMDAREALGERHPKTRFLLMHLAYPWSRDLLGLAFVYRNIWLDLTWSALLSPTYFKQSLHEAIEVLPDESRMMIGGDNWHVEETYGTIQLTRRLIAEVLQEKVDSSYFKPGDARRLARKILSENASRFFNQPIS